MSSSSARLRVPDPTDRSDLATFVGRVVRLDPAAVVRLRAGGEGRVTAWATTPFDVLATRSVPAALMPGDLTVPASALLTALSVDRAETVDVGAAALWQGLLPPDEGWAAVEAVPAAELEALADRGLALARENAGPLGPPASLLDQTVLTVSAAGTSSEESGPERPVRVPLRCLFALSGMGFLSASDAAPDGAPDVVRVTATASWLRLDARYGAVVRRRITALPLLAAGTGVS